MSIVAEYIYTEEVAVRAAQEVTKSLSSSFLFRLLVPSLARWEAQKRFRHDPNANKNVVWRFDAEKVEDEADGAPGIRAWSKFIEIREVHDDFLFFPQPRVAHWVPKSAFSSEAALSELRDLIRASGITYRG